MNMFHHSLYSQYNPRKPYLNKKLSVAQNGIFFKNVFNRKYVKFNINIMSNIVFVNTKSNNKSKTFYVTNQRT